MTKLYSSFVVRCWYLDGGIHTVEVEHIQSGGKARVASAEAAIRWIESNCHHPTGRAPSIPPDESSIKTGEAVPES